MLNVFERENRRDELQNEASSLAQHTLTLPFDQRQKSRLRVTMDNGVEASLQLKRGTILRSGDLLKAENGERILVQASPERVSTATTSDVHLFSRACYHLGNRHVPIEIGENWIRYQHDHVLDRMLIEMGLHLDDELLAFEPESGAY